MPISGWICFLTKIFIKWLYTHTNVYTNVCKISIKKSTIYLFIYQWAKCNLFIVIFKIFIVIQVALMQNNVPIKCHKFWSTLNLYISWSNCPLVVNEDGTFKNWVITELIVTPHITKFLHYTPVQKSNLKEICNIQQLSPQLTTFYLLVLLKFSRPSRKPSICCEQDKKSLH